MANGGTWDVFISHASEDKDEFVVPLFRELRTYGLQVWFDQFTLKVGDSLRESIDQGLANSRFGIVVLSHAFLEKRWPQHELNGLFAREVDGHKVILPVWHNITRSEVLRHSPLLADKLAANSSDGIEAVAKRLIEVIVPRALELEHSRQNVRAVASRLREQLKERDSRFEYHIHDVEGAEPGPPRPSPDGLVASCVQDGLKIDVVAADPCSYNHNPVSVTLTLSRKAWDSIEHAAKTGNAVELGPGDFLGASSGLFDALGFAPAAGGTLTIEPAPTNQPRRLRWRLVFALTEDREEFPFVEFDVVRAGSHEVELRSCAPPLPLTITFTLRRDEPGTCKLRYEFEGEEIRRVYKCEHALRIIRAGGVIELFDLDLDVSVGTLSVPSLADGSDTSEMWQFITTLANISTALNDKLYWRRPEWEDVENADLLAAVLKTGEVDVPVQSVTLTVTQDQLTLAEAALTRGEGLQIQWETPPFFATVLGKTFNLGAYTTRIVPTKVETLSSTNRDGCHVFEVQLVAAVPVRFIFERFKPSLNPA